jgi:UDP-glucose 4-epimerase
MILVTGASGFIGGHLAHALLDRGEKVILISKSGNFDPALKKKTRLFFRMDITQRAILKKLPGVIRAVFHTAIHPSQKPETDDDLRQCIETNALGTLNLLELCRERGIPRFIYSTSIGVYGKNVKSPVSEEHPILPETAYGMGKRMGEMFCQHYHQRHGIQHFVLRYSSVYGPDQAPDTVLPIFIQRARHDQDIVIFGKGRKQQDFVYVKDVVKANLLALRSSHPGLYHIGSGVGTGVLTLARTVGKVFGPGGKIRIRRDASKAEDATRFSMNIARAKKILKYRPDYDLEDGLRDYKTHLESEL